MKILAIADRHDLRLLVSTPAGGLFRRHLGSTQFDCYMLEAKPEHLIGDRAYDRG